MLINLSSDGEILRSLADDDAFLETLMIKITNPKEPTADDIATLLANMAKSDSFAAKIVSKTRSSETNKKDKKDTKDDSVSGSTVIVDQLLDCFVKGADNRWNSKANFDFLAYLFADLSKTAEGRRYFTTRREYDGVVPLCKLVVFTEHSSDVRRRGVASTIKNIAFDISSHPMLIREEEEDDRGVNLFPYILLPLMGPEEYDDDESAAMLPDLQLLPPTKKREPDPQIIITHLETLLLLSTTRPVRDRMREIQVYPIIRECDRAMKNEDVHAACDRLVQVLMRDEAPEETPADREALEKAQAEVLGQRPTSQVEEQKEDDEDDDDEKVVEIL